MPQTLWLVVFLIAFSIALVTMTRFDWTKKDITFRIKKIIDIAVYIIGYLILTWTHYLMLICEFPDLSFNLLLISEISVSFAALVLVTHQFFIFNKTSFPMKNLNSKFVFVSLIVGLVFSISSINYCVYLISPSFYSLPYEMSAFETAFEFLYYSVTVLLTYSSSSVEAVNIITKCIQLAEIFYSCTIIANIVVNVFNKIKKE